MSKVNYINNLIIIQNNIFLILPIRLLVISGEKQLKEFSMFLQNHQAVMNNIISKSPVISMDSGLDKEIGSTLIWAEKNSLHLNNSYIYMNFSSGPESISTLGLVQSDNKCLNKTIAVFVEMCLEVRELHKEGNSLLHKSLLANEEFYELFQTNNIDNQTTIGIPAATGDSECSKIDEIPLSPGVIIKLSTFSELLFQAKQFTDRCFVVVAEIIKQFMALFNVENSAYINIDYSSLHFQVSDSCLFNCFPNI